MNPVNPSGARTSCDENQPSAFCPACRCRKCDFCNGDGSPSGVAHEAAAEGKCTPSGDKDIDHAACLGHCSIDKKAAHCETCKVRLLRLERSISSHPTLACTTPAR